MKYLYIIIDHICGEFEDLTVSNDRKFALDMSKCGFIVYKLNLFDLSVEEIKWFMFQKKKIINVM